MSMPGSYLKEKRKEKSFTIEKVAEETKIRVVYINAIENNTLDELPTGSYVRGFIKNYARFLGIDNNVADSLADAAVAGREFFIAEDIAEDVEHTETQEKNKENLNEKNNTEQEKDNTKTEIINNIKEDESQISEKSAERNEEEAEIYYAKSPVVQEEESSKIIRKDVWGSESYIANNSSDNRGKKRTVKQRVRWPETLLIIAVILCVVGLSAYWWVKNNEQPKPAATSNAVTTGSANDKNANKPKSNAEESKKTNEQQNKQNNIVKVTGKFIGPCWIKVTIDDKTTAYEGVPATGAVMSWEANQKIDMRIGEPENLEVTCNGKGVGKIGEKGQPITKQFTRTGM